MDLLLCHLWPRPGGIDQPADLHILSWHSPAGASRPACDCTSSSRRPAHEHAHELISATLRQPRPKSAVHRGSIEEERHSLSASAFTRAEVVVQFSSANIALIFLVKSCVANFPTTWKEKKKNSTGRLYRTDFSRKVLCRKSLMFKVLRARRSAG